VFRYLWPVHRISPALRQNFIRSTPNHQLEAGVDGKILSPECRPAALLPPSTQVSGRLGGTSEPFGMMIASPGTGASMTEAPGVGKRIRPRGGSDRTTMPRA
jgi:hypothetical protein